MNNVSLCAVGLCALFISTDAASNAQHSLCSEGHCAVENSVDNGYWTVDNG